jgi:hypothetical protein
MTFEGRSTEEVRAKVRRELNADIEDLKILRHGRERHGGIFGFFQKERWLLEVEIPDAAPPEPARRVAPWRHATPAAPYQSAPDQTGSHQAPTAAPRRASAEAQRAAAMSAPASETHFDALLAETTDVVTVDFTRAFADVLADAESAVSGQDPLAAIPTPAVLAPVPTTVEPMPSTVEPVPTTGGALVGPDDLRIRATLITTGLPNELLPDPTEAHPELGLLRRLQTLPEGPSVPDGPGDVLLLVGALAETLALAERLLPGDDTPGAIVVATQAPPAGGGPGVDGSAVTEWTSRRVATTAKQAGMRVFQRRAAGLATIVVLDAAAGDSFVRKVAAGIRPQATWGVVPAGWTPERTELLAQRCGGMDAIALYDFLKGEHPGQLLGAAWPVTYLDGWVANPVSITARLMELVATPRALRSDSTGRSGGTWRSDSSGRSGGTWRSESSGRSERTWHADHAGRLEA